MDTRNSEMEKNMGSVKGFLDPSPFPSVKDILRTDYLVQIFLNPGKVIVGFPYGHRHK